MEEVVAHLFSLIFYSFHPSEAHYLVPEQFCLYKTWRTGVSLFIWLLPLDLSRMSAPTSSYATAGIAFRVSGVLKPHHHDKVETPSVGNVAFTFLKIIA
jgi:hypothetical protein